MWTCHPARRAGLSASTGLEHSFGGPFDWRRIPTSSVRGENPPAKRESTIATGDCKLAPEPARGPIRPRVRCCATEERFAVWVTRLRKPGLGRYALGHELSELFMFRIP